MKVLSILFMIALLLVSYSLINVNAKISIKKNTVESEKVEEKIQEKARNSHSSGRMSH